MRLILEKEEIVSILSKHFDAKLDPERVVIRTDPLEIEVCGLPLSGSTKAPEPPISVPPSALPPVPEHSDDTGVSPAAVLAASKALEAELARENPKGKRRAGSYSLVPPPLSEDET